MRIWLGIFIFGLKALPVIGQYCLDSANQLVNEAECLDGIHQKVHSDQAFWFGDDWTNRCQGSSVARLPECINFDPSGTNMAKRLVNGNYDLTAEQLKYVNVTYTSLPGEYSGCDHKVKVTETKIFTLDPLRTRISHKPWDARELPQITWQAAANELYTLLIVDAGYLFMHGVYVNIPGKDMSQSQIIKAYHGPQNANALVNPYAFLLLKQNGRVVVAEEFKAVLRPGSRERFNISKFRDDHNMTGPVGWNWLLASYDVYSVENQRKWGSENCAIFVQEKVQNFSKPFLPANPSLKGYLRIEFEMGNINFEVCCKKYTLEAESVVLDPIGDSLQTAAGTRSENARQMELRLTGMNVNSTVALAGKYLTLIMVDTDVSPDAGTESKPLAHWLRINMVNGDFSTGEEVLAYMGPAPPDDKTHTYYFLLYEHSKKLSSHETKQYSGPNCPPSIQNRCLFDINSLTSNETLTLISATWMKVRNDAYVKSIYKRLGQKENSLCEGVVGYSDPCPTSAALSQSQTPRDVTLICFSFVLFIINKYTNFEIY